MTILDPDDLRDPGADAVPPGHPAGLDAAATPATTAGPAHAIDDATRFRAVFEHAPIGQIYTTLDGVIASVNEPLAGALGLTPADMIDEPALTFVEPGEAERVRDTAAALLGGARPVTEVRVFRHRDGHPVPVRVTSTLLRDDEGRPGMWVSMVVDMTAEQRGHAQLENAHRTAVGAIQRLELLHTISTAANEATNLDELAPTVLAATCQHFGWTSGALVGWTSRPDGSPAAHVRAVHGPDPVGAPWLDRPAGLDVTIRKIEADVDTGTAADSGAWQVVVPLCSDRDEQLAWLFGPGAGPLGEHQREVLHLVGNESRRVLERETAARMLRDGETRFRSVFDFSPLPMGLTVGDSGTYSAVNDALCELLGRSEDELLGMSARDLCHPDDRPLTDPAGAAAAAAPDRRHTFELRFLRASGEAVVTNTTLIWMDGPDGSRQLLAQIEDITARRTMEQLLRRQALEDDLTGLANRARLTHVLSEKAALAATCAVLFIDLDGFKLINDTRGHDVGDEVLRTVAARLLAAVRPTDLVARFGGDEFVVLCDAVAGAEHDAARRIARRIEQSVSIPVPTHSGSATITASVGIAAGRVETSEPQALVQHADAAMYEAKRLGKDRCEIYDVRLHERARQHQHTEAALRNALDDGRFAVHYQPIVTLDEATIIGFEALVRLVDEDGSLVMPDQFIAVAERSGLIVPMGAWVLHESCQAIARLRKLCGRPLTVAVNIAARQVARPDFDQVVRAALAGSGLPDSALTLELTESALLEADATTLDQLVQLRNGGVTIALDDFGTGYSSLSYLRRFPVGHLKVDRSFVSGMVDDLSDRAIVRAVTGLAGELGMRWVAEGVETQEQRDALARMGDGLAQGYLFSRPRPEIEVAGLLGLDDTPYLRSA